MGRYRGRRESSRTGREERSMRPGDPFAPPPEELGDPFAEDRGGKKPALRERWGAYWE